MTVPMDYLNAGLDAVQNRLAWVSTDPFDWKLYLQASSWAVCLFESYLLYASLPPFTRGLHYEAGLDNSVDEL